MPTKKSVTIRSSGRTTTRSRSRSAFPTRAIIAGEEWEIRLVPNLKRDRDAYGYVTFDDRLIEIEPRLGKRQRYITLLHEVLHALIPGRLLGKTLEEELVQAIDTDLYDFLADNGLLKKRHS